MLFVVSPSVLVRDASTHTIYECDHFIVYTVVPVMNGHPRDQATRQKCPYMTGGCSSEGRVGGSKRNTPCTTTFMTTMLNTMPCIVINIYVYAIGNEPKSNAS